MEKVLEKNQIKSDYSKSFFNRRSWSIALQLIADNFAFSLSLILFYVFIFESGAVERRGIPEKDLIVIALAIMNLYWMFFFFISGLYKNWYERSPFDEYFLLLRTTFIGTGIFYFLVMVDTEKSPRLMSLYYFLILFGVSILFRTLIRRFQKRLRRKKVINHTTLILGNADQINESIERMERSPTWGMRPIGGIGIDDSSISNDKVLGTLENFPEIIDLQKPDVLVIATKSISEDNLFRITQLCSDNGIRTKIEPDLYSLFTGQSKTHNIYGIPYIEINPVLMSGFELTIKRIFDIIFSGLVILIGLPLWILISLAIVLETKGGVFYTQYRSGRNGEPFKIWKFRSMVRGADRFSGWTSVGDARVTRIGKFIRKTHLDEIPQFWNVLIGDMSVVGPRPEQPHLVKEFTESFPAYKRRLIIKPGITGWWQVKYKPYEMNDEEIKNRLKDDFYYIENMSIKFDIEIIIRTVWAVLSGHGQS